MNASLAETNPNSYVSGAAPVSAVHISAARVYSVVRAEPPAVGVIVNTPGTGGPPVVTTTAVELVWALSAVRVPVSVKLMVERVGRASGGSTKLTGNVVSEFTFVKLNELAVRATVDRSRSAPSTVHVAVPAAARLTAATTFNWFFTENTAGNELLIDTAGALSDTTVTVTCAGEERSAPSETTTAITATTSFDIEVLARTPMWAVVSDCGITSGHS